MPVHFQSGGTTTTSSPFFRDVWDAVERVPPKSFTRREIPVSARTSQTWLRRFNSTFASRSLQTATKGCKL